MIAKPTRSGFTLVEILIVVIILGILAAMVIPKFANASREAKFSSLLSSLQSIRGQVELYMLQHGDTPPALTGADWTDLTEQGLYGTQAVGPYLRAAPVNPLNGYSNVLVVAADQVGGDAVASPGTGFVYNSTNGKLWATNTLANRVFNEVNIADPAN
jgi:general secretion pathway protein G